MLKIIVPNIRMEEETKPQKSVPCINESHLSPKFVKQTPVFLITKKSIPRKEKKSNAPLFNFIQLKKKNA